MLLLFLCARIVYIVNNRSVQSILTIRNNRFALDFRKKPSRFAVEHEILYTFYIKLVWFSWDIRQDLLPNNNSPTKIEHIICHSIVTNRKLVNHVCQDDIGIFFEKFNEFLWICDIIDWLILELATCCGFRLTTKTEETVVPCQLCTLFFLKKKTKSK